MTTFLKTSEATLNIENKAKIRSEDISEMKNRYQQGWDINMMAYFCWVLKNETNQNREKRKKNSLHKSFDTRKKKCKSNIEENLIRVSRLYSKVIHIHDIY